MSEEALYARISELEADVARLRRKIAAFPARQWFETDDPDVVACLGSAPECARWGCQARVLAHRLERMDDRNA